jgi:hypothetical protein
MAGLGSLVVSLVAEASEFIAGFDKAAAKASSSSKAIDVSMASMAKGFVAAQAAMAAVQSTL